MQLHLAYKKTLNQLIRKETRVIGLTATSIRGIKSTENDELMDFFLGNILDLDTGDDDNVISYLTVLSTVYVL